MNLLGHKKVDKKNKSVFIFFGLLISAQLVPLSFAGRTYTHTPIAWHEDVAIVGPGATYGSASDYSKTFFNSKCPTPNATLREDSVLGDIPGGNGLGNPRRTTLAKDCGLVFNNTTGFGSTIGHVGKIILNNTGTNDQTIKVEAKPINLTDSPVKAGLLNGYAPIAGSRSVINVFTCTAQLTTMGTETPYVSGLAWDSGTNSPTTGYPHYIMLLRPGATAVCLFYSNYLTSGQIGADTDTVVNFKIFGGIIYEFTVAQNLGAVTAVIQHGIESTSEIGLLNPESEAFNRHTEFVVGPGRPF